jgi:hypothetical protein
MLTLVAMSSRDGKIVVPKGYSIDMLDSWVEPNRGFSSSLCGL